MRRLYSTLLLVPILALPGCQTVALAVATPIAVQKKYVNVLNASYAAIDTLTQKTTQRLNKRSPILVPYIREIIPEPDKTGPGQVQKVHPNPNLGRALGEQYATRLIDLGYNVVDEATYNSAKNGTELAGTYKISSGNFIGFGKKLYVSLSLRDKTSGRIIGVHSYTLPVTDEVREYMADGNVLLPKMLRD